MTRIALLALGLLSLSAFSALKPATAVRECGPAAQGDYLKLCEQFITEQGAAECVKIGNGAYFNACAFQMCSRFQTENGLLNGMRAVKNKDYTAAETEFCNRFNTEQGLISCLNSAGTHHYPPSTGVNLYEVKRRVDIALGAVQNNEPARAERTLLDLLYYLEGFPH